MGKEHKCESPECVICSGVDADGFYEKIAKDIEKSGRSIIGVFPSENDPMDVPGYAYSIGVTECDHPELFMSGLPFHIMAAIINDVGNKIIDGKKLTDGEQLEGFLTNGYKLKVHRVDAKKHVDSVNQVRQYYKTDDIEVFQLLWPDKAGNFPDSEKFEDSLAQEVLK